MADDLNLSRLPRGQRAWNTLVATVGSMDDRAERYFLEVKSTVDLTKKEHQAKVAKFILGADNRDPQRAAKRFDGHAIMILGVSADGIVGVPSFEAKDLEDSVLRYISTEGPSWDFERLVIQGKDVICIIVDPPRPEVVATCYRDGPENLRNGAIYIRVDGQTREAHGDEVRQLLGNLTNRVPEPELAVQILGPVKSVPKLDEVFDEYIATHARRLRAALQEAQANEERRRKAETGGSYLSQIYAATMPSPGYIGYLHRNEDRTPEKYEEEICGWASSVRDAQASIATRLVSRTGPRNSVVLTNKSKRYLEDVEVKIHLEGDVRGTKVVLENAEVFSKLPKKPRSWGPYQVQPFDPSAAFISAIPPSVHAGSYSRDVVTYRNSGSVDLTFELESLRPVEEYTSDDDEFMLVVDGEFEGTIRGTWRATARGVHEVFEGELELSTVSTSGLDNAVRRYLQLVDDSTT